MASSRLRLALAVGARRTAVSPGSSVDLGRGVAAEVGQPEAVDQHGRTAAPLDAGQETRTGISR